MCGPANLNSQLPKQVTDVPPTEFFCVLTKTEMGKLSQGLAIGNGTKAIHSSGTNESSTGPEESGSGEPFGPGFML